MATSRLSVFETWFKVNGMNETRLLMDGNRLLVNGSIQSVNGSRLLVDRSSTEEDIFIYTVKGNRNYWIEIDIK